MCDRWDIGGLSTPRHPDTDAAQIFIYDGFPGGVGIAEKGFELLPELWAATLDVIAGLPVRRRLPELRAKPEVRQLQSAAGQGGCGADFAVVVDGGAAEAVGVAVSPMGLDAVVNTHVSPIYGAPSCSPAIYRRAVSRAICRSLGGRDDVRPFVRAGRHRAWICGRRPRTPGPRNDAPMRPGGMRCWDVTIGRTVCVATSGRRTGRRDGRRRRRSPGH